MDPLKLLKVKPLEEILLRLRRQLQHHRRRYLRKYLRPCPENCASSDVVGHRVVGCRTCCGSSAVETCRKPNLFKPLFTKQQLCEQFAEDIRNPQVLLRDYRDLVVFFWVVGAFDEKVVDEQVVSGVEKAHARLP